MSSNTRFILLDGARGIAALAVVLFHLYSGTNRVFENFFLLVDFFFVLSGFLITFLLLKEHAKKNTISIRKFYIRRILRIWPLYFLLVLIGTIILPLILSFIDTFGAFFGPLFGVIIVDYYLIKKSSLSNKDIYSVEADSAYYYSKGWHIKALYSLIIGFIFSASTIWNINLMFLQSYAWIIGAIVSSTTYYLLAKK